MPSTVPRHKVFISYHDDKNDRRYKDRFGDMMKGYIVDKSVHDEDIDDVNLSIETIRQRIRDNFISDATVTATSPSHPCAAAVVLDWMPVVSCLP